MTSSSTLDGVTLDTDLSVPDGTTLTIRNGLTLQGTLTLNRTGTYNTTYLNFSGTQTLSGTGSVVIVNSNGSGFGNVVLEPTSGTLTVGSDMTIHGQHGVIGNSALPLVNQGKIDADAAGQTIFVTGSSVTNDGTLAADGGALSVSGLASPMADVLTAGAGAVLTVNGSLNLDPTGTVNVDLGGTGTTQYGQINVTAAASLAGTLNVTVVNGYQPASGDALKIMTFTSENGTFTTFNGSAISTNLVWAPVYNAQDLTLVAGAPQLANVGAAASVGGHTTFQVPFGMEVSHLQLAEVASLMRPAIDRWTVAGLAPHLAAMLGAVDISIAHLGNDVLALTAGNRILLSDDADGLGWFVDPTPSVDGGFQPTPADHVLAALAGTAAAGRFDLLTVLDHELGHLLGLPDQVGGHGLIAERLAVGMRRSPSTADVAPTELLRT